MWNRRAPVVRTCPRSSPLVLPRPLRVVEHQHALIVQLAVLVRLDTEVLPAAQELTGSRCRGQPRLAGFGAIGGHELDLGVRPLGRAKVAACPSRGGPATFTARSRQPGHDIIRHPAARVARTDWQRGDRAGPVRLAPCRTIGTASAGGAWAQALARLPLSDGGRAPVRYARLPHGSFAARSVARLAAGWEARPREKRSDSFD
jgi:hypothetical protein